MSADGKYGKTRDVRQAEKYFAEVEAARRQMEKGPSGEAMREIIADQVARQMSQLVVQGHDGVVANFKFPHLNIAAQQQPTVQTTVARSSSMLLPFSASWNKADGKIAVSGGTYQDGAGGAFHNVAEKTLTTGTKAYLCVKQTGDVNIDHENVSIVVTSTEKDPTNLDETSTFVEWSNILIAEVVGTGDSARLVQRMHGNIMLTHWAINGYAARWFETVIGGMP